MLLAHRVMGDRCARGGRRERRGFLREQAGRVAAYRRLSLVVQFRPTRSRKPWNSRDLGRVEDVRRKQERAYQGVSQGNQSRAGGFRKFNKTK
jgi:hypothetical protein